MKWRYARQTSRGFTLIELLVVVSIIGLMSSIVLSAVNTARDKAKDASIKAQVMQMRNLMELEFSETGSYAGLQESRWIGDTSGGNPLNYADCSTINWTSSSYSARARAMCVSILKSIKPSSGTTIWLLAATQVGSPSKYSIMAKLSNDYFYCVSSSGATSALGTSADSWTAPGCWGNP